MAVKYEKVKIGKIKGEDGKTPYIGNNGNWWIGDSDLGVSATKLDVSDLAEIYDIRSGRADYLRPTLYLHRFSCLVDNAQTFIGNIILNTSKKIETLEELIENKMFIPILLYGYPSYVGLLDGTDFIYIQNNSLKKAQAITQFIDNNPQIINIDW